MRNPRNVSTRWQRWLVLAVIVGLAGVTGACKCPKANQAIAIVEVQGGFFSFPDTNRPNDPVPAVRPGEIVSFVNTTGKECTITADDGAFEGDTVFTVKAHTCKKATVSDLTPGSTFKVTIDCEGDDHGSPGMIVQGGTPRDPS